MRIKPLFQIQILDERIQGLKSFVRTLNKNISSWKENHLKLRRYKSCIRCWNFVYFSVYQNKLFIFYDACYYCHIKNPTCLKHQITISHLTIKKKNFRFFFLYLWRKSLKSNIRLAILTFLETPLFLLFYFKNLELIFHYSHLYFSSFPYPSVMYTRIYISLLINFANSFSLFSYNPLN